MDLGASRLVKAAFFDDSPADHAMDKGGMGHSEEERFADLHGHPFILAFSR